ncbi:MAG: alpha/beta hydrolase [Clostridia bacterium]|nr:alpha/beta hydrolase [Clostridia bacterium]
MYTTVNDVDLYYECYGQGDELLFIPGNGTSFKYMLRLAKLLSKEYKVYLVDRRGQGKSTKKCELSYELNVQDIYEFIQKLNITKPVIIGHSGGAVIAMALGLKYKHVVNKIILCSGATNLKATNPKYIKKWKLYSKFRIINPKIIDMVLAQQDLREGLKEITAKTLVLAGGKDIINREDTHTIARLIPDSKLKIYEKENHSSYITNTTCYKDIINFLKED